MSNTQIEQTLSHIKAELDQLELPVETTHGNDLFPLIEKAFAISPFVVCIFNAEFNRPLIETVWHFNNSAAEFDDYLKHKIQLQLLKQAVQYQADCHLVMDDFLPELQSQSAIMQWLRVTRRSHSAAIAVLELNAQISIEESMERMSLLAENLTQIAYRWSMAFHQQTFGNCYLSTEHDFNKNQQQNMLILAMGKFGGGELNFSSDIDLIFFYSSNGQTQGGRRSIEYSRFFQKIGVLLIKLLDEVTQDGFVFRVDMRLRPYGDSGNLVMSVDQAEDYYHEQGRGWERFAMVRAKIMTGRKEEKQSL